MRRDFSDHHLPPLSTRMIFLHHRVRLHDQVSHGKGRYEPMPLAAGAVLATMLLIAAILLGVLHA